MANDQSTWLWMFDTCHRCIMEAGCRWRTWWPAGRTRLLALPGSVSTEIRGSPLQSITKSIVLLLSIDLLASYTFYSCSSYLHLSPFSFVIILRCSSPFVLSIFSMCSCCLFLFRSCCWYFLSCTRRNFGLVYTPFSLRIAFWFCHPAVGVLLFLLWCAARIGYSRLHECFLLST